MLNCDQGSNDDDQSDQRGSSKRVSSRHRYQNPSDEDDPPVQHQRPRRSPSHPVKKQIIPLSDNSLIGDVARAKRAYVHREPSDEYEYEDDEEEEEYIQQRRKRDAVRRRKASVIHSDEEKEEISNSLNRSSWFLWIPFFGRKKEKVDEPEEDDKSKKKEKQDKETVCSDACHFFF